MMTAQEKADRRQRRAAERKRRAAALAQATLEGVFTYPGTDECAILCAGCGKAMLILRPADRAGIGAACSSVCANKAWGDTWRGGKKS